MAAIGGQVGGLEVTGVPVAGEAGRARRWRRGLAAGFAALLAILPFARPSLPVALTPATVAFWQASERADDGLAQPAPRLRPAQPFDLGALLRWGFETQPRLLPAEPIAVRLAWTGALPAAPRATRAPDGNPRDVFQLSSVGTARRPTGPPSPASA